MIEQVLNRVDIGDCWEWTGARTTAGYGSLGAGYQPRYVHRYVYTHLVDDIAPGMQLDHLCKVRHCCNPDHLEPVTQAENVRRSASGWRSAGKTHCPHGHEYAGDNLYIDTKGARRCKTCMGNEQRLRRAVERQVAAMEGGAQ